MNEKPWLNHYDANVPSHLDYPLITVVDIFNNAVRRFPHHPCTIFSDAVITYAKMDSLTDCLADCLVDLGVKKGAHIGILMPNIPQFIIAFFAILKVGAVVVAFNPLYSEREIENQAVDSGIGIFLVSSKHYAKVKNIQPLTALRTIIVTKEKEFLPFYKRFWMDLLKQDKEEDYLSVKEGDYWLQELLHKSVTQKHQPIESGAEEAAILQFSGGTTGVSKGAIGTNYNIVANTLQLSTWLNSGLSGKVTILVAIPLYHIFGMVSGMMLSIQKGAVIVLIPNPRDIKDILKHIYKYKVTVFPGVPTLFNAINHAPQSWLNQYHLSSLKVCISGSATLLREVKDAFEALSGSKLLEGYGLSETPTATHCNPLVGENRTGSIGLPLSDVDCRIVDLEDGETDQSFGKIGELVIRGPQVFRGYYQMPEETKNTLRNGWLYTGDIAHMDEDGYFFLAGRKKELIKTNGFQVWPREIEEVISTHPKVLEVAAAGINDDYRGEVIKVWIIPKSGMTLNGQEILDYCKTRLAIYKLPTQIEIRQELPKTSVGKILRRELVREHQEKDINRVG